MTQNETERLIAILRDRPGASINKTAVIAEIRKKRRMSMLMKDEVKKFWSDSVRIQKYIEDVRTEEMLRLLTHKEYHLAESALCEA